MSYTDVELRTINWASVLSPSQLVPLAASAFTPSARRSTGSHVPYKSLVELRAAFKPDAALDLCLMPTPQGVTMSPKSSVPPAASSDSQVLMSDTGQSDDRGSLANSARCVAHLNQCPLGEVLRKWLARAMSDAT